MCTGFEKFDDMPAEVREYLEEHCKGAHFGPPGPWMLFGKWGCGSEAGEEAPGDVLDHLLGDAPDEVKQWFREHLGQFKGAHFGPPGPWMFWHHLRHHGHGPWHCGHGPWHRGRRSRRYRPGPWMWADDGEVDDMPDEVKQWFRQHFERRFKGCHPQSAEPTEPSSEEPPATAA